MLMQTLNSNIVCPCAQVVAHMPQNDLLAHPQTRGFLFQGGIYSQYEAVYHGKPVVVMPFFAGAAPLWMRLKYVTSAKELRVVWTALCADQVTNSYRIVAKVPVCPAPALLLIRSFQVYMRLYCIGK